MAGSDSGEERFTWWQLECMSTAVQNLPDAVIGTDNADIIRYMNPAAQALTGCDAAQVVGQLLVSVMSLVFADSGAAVTSAIETAKTIDGGGRELGRVLLLGSNQHPVLVECTVLSMRDSNGLLYGAVSLFQDVTRHAAAGMALPNTEARLLANAQALFEEKDRARVTLDSIDEAIISIDFRGRIAFLNHVAEAMTGWKQADAVGKPLDQICFLVDATTRQHVTFPIVQAIIEDHRIDIESMCILIRRDGTETPVNSSASPIHDANGGVVGAVFVAHDVTAARDQTKALARLALHDNLTDLPNRALLLRRISEALTIAEAGGTSVAVLFIDLNKFKPVNDSFGHSVGDELLKAVADRLRQCVRSSDTVSRYGGDEFIILITYGLGGDPSPVANKVLRAFETPYEIAGHVITIGASVGIASYPVHASDAESLLRFADAAMYQAKKAGANQSVVFGTDTESDAD